MLLQRYLDEIEPHFDRMRGASEAARSRFANEIQLQSMIDRAPADPRVMRWCCVLGTATDVYQKYGWGRGALLAGEAALLAERSPAWRRDFFLDAFRQEWLAIPEVREVAYQLAPEVPRPRDMFFLDWFARRNLAPPAGLSTAAQARFTQEYEQFLQTDLWLLFQTPGIGSFSHESIIPSLVALAEPSAPLRKRLLDESLAALTLDFSVYDSAWYLDLHRALAPGRQEIAARERGYQLALGAAAGNAVAFAQEHLALLVDEGEYDLAGLMHASAAVFTRADKKSILAQLKLLTRVAADGAGARAAVAAALAPLAADGRLDLAERARGLIETLDPAAGGSPTQRSGATPRVPPPRLADLPERADPAPGLVDDPDELAELFAAMLENPRPAVDLVRACESVLAIAHRRPLAANALGKRALKIVVETYDADVVDPRRFVGRVILSWLGIAGPRVHHQGHNEMHLLGPGQIPPPGYVATPRPYLYRWDESVDYSEAASADGKPWSEDRAGRTYHHLSRPSWSPSALLMFWLEEVAVTLQNGAGERPVAAALTLSTRRGPSAPARWERTSVSLRPRIAASVILWRDRAAALASTDAIADAPFDLSDLESEYRVRSERARWLRHNVAYLDGWCLIFGDAVDHLAAQGHPELSIAVGFVNVDTAPIVDAIGSARRALGDPSYSALVLACADKTARGRAIAAEAIASLAQNGLFAPPQFAEQLTACLTEKHVMAGRIASTLADATAISAIAGWRVLEIVVEVLPTAASATGGAKLVELAAKLATDYGVAISVPAELASKSKGSGPMAVAVRSLLASSGFETSLALEAAEQARSALEA